MEGMPWVRAAVYRERASNYIDVVVSTLPHTGTRPLEEA